MPARYLDPYRLKRKALYINPVEHENLLLKALPEHELLQNSSADNYVVTPHRKRRPGFHNSPAQNPPFVPSYLEDLRQPHKNFLTQSMSAPPAYLGGGENRKAWRAFSIFKAFAILKLLQAFIPKLISNLFIFRFWIHGSSWHVTTTIISAIWHAHRIQP